MVAGHLQEKNGIYQIILELKDSNGCRKQKWISTGLPVKGNKKKAEMMLNEVRQKYIDEESTEKKKEEIIFFSDYLINEWMPTKQRLEGITYTAYQNEVKSIVKYFDERRITLKEITVNDIEGYYNSLRRRGLSETTIHKHHTKIFGALKLAVKEGLVLANVAASVDVPVPEHFQASFYNSTDMFKLLEVVKGTKLEVIVMLGFYGLRRSEIVGLKWDAVDFEHNSISIQYTVTEYMKDGKKIIQGKPRTKNKSSRRTLPMIPPLKVKLLALKEKQETLQKYCRESYIKQYLEFICVDDIGNLIKPDYITQTFRKLLEKSGLRIIRFHDLRHSCASLLLANGISMKEIQEWLGHSTFKTTADIYAHLAFDSKLTSANALATGTAFSMFMEEPKQQEKEENSLERESS